MVPFLKIRNESIMRRIIDAAMGMFRGGKPEALKQKAPNPEAREKQDGVFFLRIPPEHRQRIRDFVISRFTDFRDRFPSEESFQEAISQTWLERKSGFEEEMGAMDFETLSPTMLDAETALNEYAIAVLTANGTHVVVGPGAFDKRMGASIVYEPGNFWSSVRSAKSTKSTGFVFDLVPKMGKSLMPAQGRSAPFAATSPVISIMIKKPSPKEASSLPEQVSRRIATRFDAIDTRIRLNIPQPEKTNS